MQGVSSVVRVSKCHLQYPEQLPSKTLFLENFKPNEDVRNLFNRKNKDDEDLENSSPE